MPDSSSPPPRRFVGSVRLLGLFVVGLIAGVFFHYLLFRLGLPVQPFIYAAF